MTAATLSNSATSNDRFAPGRLEIDIEKRAGYKQYDCTLQVRSQWLAPTGGYEQAPVASV
jgi:hypothetical protein